MDNSRMSTADMLQYCNEALAWDDFGPIDIFFFESVKKILLGQCSALEEPEEYTDDLMGIERPVRDVELEPEYGNYADIYYGEEGDDDIPDYSATAEDEAFAAEMFTGGFFNDPEGTAAVEAAEAEAAENEPDGKAAAKTTKKPAAKKSAAKKTASKKPAVKKAAAKKASPKKDKSAESDKHEETTGGGFTVKL
ncbi:MAG: hypothetical protein J5724_01455 [Ruminococcus sp.]|uniref:hypothetical protein n=1 Tax=Ruminococcus sp. TaxID=41978 RepID=UPI001B4A0A3E|nr:hypothetical protein [Ruminococcus sp.]MBO4493032.1 hypothetical protein [Ruminococcus sp.]MBP5432306.1 hypothetical protein [Ruminococcus sp.]